MKKYQDCNLHQFIFQTYIHPHALPHTFAFRPLGQKGPHLLYYTAWGSVSQHQLIVRYTTSTLSSQNHHIQQPPYYICRHHHIIQHHFINNSSSLLSHLCIINNLLLKHCISNYHLSLIILSPFLFPPGTPSIPMTPSTITFLTLAFRFPTMLH